ncbi:MAG: hypothetical protein ACOZBW_08020 [Thermodesulfobacteriota bacterium]
MKNAILATCATVVFALLLPHDATAWELPLLTDRQGTFEFFSRTDYANENCGFSKAEMEANLKEIRTLVDTMRKNPVLADLKGYDSHVRIYNTRCDDMGGHGIPSLVSFGFCSWYQGKGGTPTRITIEPPDWKIVVNRQKPGAWPFNTAAFEGDSNWFKAPAKKETLGPGIDRYDGEIYVIYNPDRPAYWLPVTVREAADKLRAYGKAQPDKFSAEFMLKMIDEGYAAFPESDRDKLAYYGGEAAGGRNVMGVTSDSSGLPIMRVNPEYWDRNLPRSAIQFLYFRITDTNYSRKKMEEALKGNSTSYNLYRFEASLDINIARSLALLVQK